MAHLNIIQCLIDDVREDKRSNPWKKYKRLRRTRNFPWRTSSKMIINLFDIYIARYVYMTFWSIMRSGVNISYDDSSIDNASFVSSFLIHIGTLVITSFWLSAWINSLLVWHLPFELIITDDVIMHLFRLMQLFCSIIASSSRDIALCAQPETLSLWFVWLVS